jgi:hypothetical protein
MSVIENMKRRKQSCNPIEKTKKQHRSEIGKHRNRAHIQLNKLITIHNAQTNGCREERDYSEKIELQRRNPWNESEVAERMCKV